MPSNFHKIALLLKKTMSKVSTCTPSTVNIISISTKYFLLKCTNLCGVTAKHKIDLN